MKTNVNFWGMNSVIKVNFLETVGASCICRIYTMVRLLPHLWVTTLTMYTASYILNLVTCVWTTELVCALTNSNLCYKQGSCLYYWLNSWPHTSSTYMFT